MARSIESSILAGGYLGQHPAASQQAPSATRETQRKTSETSMSIVDNRKAFFNYFIEERLEAGLALEGWEVKAIRAGRAQLTEAYVVVRSGQVVLLGSHISPLLAASSHVKPDPTRTRTLLLHRKEINTLMGRVDRAGYTMVPLNLHFSKGRIKLEIGLAKGKKQHDKRETEKDRDWNRDKQRLMRQVNRSRTE